MLFELESSVERATLQMATARRDLVFAKWERHQALIRDGVLTPQEADELRQERALAEAAHAEAQAVLQRRTVRSPIDAHVVERLASPGEYVRDNVVLKLAELDPLHAELTWPAESRPRLRVGQTMRLQAGGAVLQGQVRIVDPLNDAASGTFGVRVVVPNPGLRVAAGQMCRVLP